MSKKRQHKPLIQTVQDLREAINALLKHPECPDSFTRRLSALHDDLEDLTIAPKSSPAQEAQENFYDRLTRIIVGDDKKIRELIELGRKPEIKRDTFYTLNEVATLASVSYSTIRNAIQNGHLKADQIGSEPRILGAAIFQWLEEGGKTGRSKRDLMEEAGE